MRIFILLIAALFFIQPIKAEILRVQIKWPPATCQVNCAQLLAQKFQQVQGVAQVYMNQPAGQVELRWKPNFPFSYQTTYTAMQLVGLWYDEFRVKVRGTIRINGNQVILVSLGDNTQFILLGTVQPQQGKYVTEYNTQTRGFTPALLAQLQQAAIDNRVAIVEGPLFMPERSPPLYLIVAQLNLVIPEQSQ
jgi:hypothetical protein